MEYNVMIPVIKFLGIYKQKIVRTAR